ncbi:MAG: hypothetical protein KA165_04490 [Saprospiraceae bacterium]|nr:hypothetical protein [Saprospiraceae bacterium]
MTDFGNRFAAFLRTVQPESRLRLAPTPSGYLHTGNALNFVLNWLAARLHGARILLRIDDLDADRKRPEYVQDIFETLERLGLDWDEGPRSPEDFERNWSQHRRLPLYFNVLERLQEKELLFACRKSRRDLAPFEGDYPPEFREQGLALSDADVAWRIKTPPDFCMPDFIVRRRDGLPAYQIASLADDLHFGITHVIRGADLENSTDAQCFLAACVGEDKFLKIKVLHHPLITDEHGEKLSKSAGATSLKALREGGEGVERVFRQVADMLGLPDEANSAVELLRCLNTQ